MNRDKIKVVPIHRSLNQGFFKKWSPEMAYVLGFITADGNLNVGRRGNCYLEINSTDKDILEKIKSALDSDHLVSSRKRHRKWKQSFRIQIGSKIIFEDLEELGLVPNKSKVLVYPEIPSKCFSHFTRGYFDGDGHVTTRFYDRKNRKTKNHILLSGFTSGTKNFLEKLHQQLRRKTLCEAERYTFPKGQIV